MYGVALRKESVDRNGLGLRHYCDDVSSLSARRAWIEIASCRRVSGCPLRSLSARRAWIEICLAGAATVGAVVALRKESVDRNHDMPTANYVWGRSLSARRAWIEICLAGAATVGAVSLSARRAWIEISVKDLNAHLYYRRSPQGERG